MSPTTSEVPISRMDLLSYSEFSLEGPLEAQAYAELWTKFSLSPSVHVYTEASIFFGITNAEAEASAEVIYFARLNETGGPPNGVLPIPVRFQGSVSGYPYRGEMISFSYSSAITLDVGGKQHSWAVAGSLIPSSNDFSEVFWLRVGDVAMVRLHVECRASVGDFFGGCGADADPTFTLDQQAFDAVMGTNTFPLNAAYKIDYSANLVPEPASILLVSMGLLFAGLRTNAVFACKRKRLSPHR